MTKHIALPLLTAVSLSFAAPALAANPSHDPAPAAAASLTESYVVEGMVCEGCAQTVTTRLKAVAGVKHVQVNLKARTATVTYANPRNKAGYQKLSQSLTGPFSLKPAAKTGAHAAPHH
ncbi:copper exporting ATPase [compost metagenome]